MVCVVSLKNGESERIGEVKWKHEIIENGKEWN